MGAGGRRDGEGVDLCENSRKSSLDQLLRLENANDNAISITELASMEPLSYAEDIRFPANDPLETDPMNEISFSER